MIVPIPSISFRNFLSIVQYIAASIIKESILEVQVMLRCLIPSESLLIRLINQREWEGVKLRLKEFKEEATPTHSAFRGIAPTALVLSLRNKANVDVIQALVDANIEQIQVKHHRHGTALHEAIRNDVNIDVVVYLLRKVVEYERSLKWKARGELMPITVGCGNSNERGSRSPNVVNDFPVDSSRNSYHVHSTLLNQSDGMGRSPLHYLIERYVATQTMRGCKEDIELVIQKFVKAFPPSVGKRDSDGLTPLDMALIGRMENDAGIDLEYEMKIFRLCSLLLEAYPSALIPQLTMAKASLKLPSHLACCKHDEESVIVPRIRRQKQLGYPNFNTRSSSEMPDDGNIENNPLSYAILHGRHSSTIELLLNSSAQIGTSWHTGCIDQWEGSSGAAYGSLCCMVLVSRNLEVPLHVATTMNAPLDILSNIVTSNPLACAVEDRCGLTPFDWLWIRYLLQESSYRENSHILPIRLSRRRIISEELAKENKIQSERLIDAIFARARNQDMSVLHQQLKILNSRELQLLEKIRVLLPAAAESLSKFKSGCNMYNPSKTLSSWSAMHAAAYLECPPFLLLMTVISSPRLLMVKDSFGNLPLHYLAARSDYKKNIPSGVTSTPLEFSEAIPIEEIVSLNPKMLQIYNEEGRLPIHIAIDRHVSKRNEPRAKCKALILCKSDPETLEKIDGKTGLLPFVLSAVGPSSDLSLIYNLLRECPSLL